MNWGRWMDKWLYVFRVRCEHVVQGDLFSEEREPGDVIVDALLAMPAGEIGGGSEWHIAAPEQFDGGPIYFQIGRVQQITSPQYDERTQKFYESEAELAPYTHGVFDPLTQVCGIEKKNLVSAVSSEIASKFEKLLNIPPFTDRAGVRIVVDEIRDPEGFIEKIKNSYRVTRFSFSAEFENAHDVQSLIHRPAERYNELIKGSVTTVETRGDDLDKEVVEEVARSAASVGDFASATIREGKEGKKKTVYLRGTPLLEKLVVPEKVTDFKYAMLSALRSAYHRVRRPDGG